MAKKKSKAEKHCKKLESFGGTGYIIARDVVNNRHELLRISNNELKTSVIIKKESLKKAIKISRELLGNKETIYLDTEKVVDVERTTVNGKLITVRDMNYDHKSLNTTTDVDKFRDLWNEKE